MPIRIAPETVEVTMDANDDKRLVVDQFTQQANLFREFAEMPGDPREIVLAAADIKPVDTVLDVACGPGVTTCDLAQCAQHATGIDITPAMIEEAKRLQQENGLTNVAWYVHAVPPLPFGDETFSLVFTRYSFHHFADPLAVLIEMARVCKPGGRIVVVDVFMTTIEQADVFNRMEKLRDPSHVRALLLEEFTELFGHAGLGTPKTVYYKQPMTLARLLNGSFPNPGDEDRVRQRIVEDVGKDELGLGSQWKDGDVQFTYPIAVFGCSKE